ncbi:MAG TPA: immunity 52 family protein [Myxococcaceae bacterium]|nr:immunity 52 family protein [Myxococcaceae bacterium]
MNETYYLGAYWGPRREDAETCAQRTAGLIQMLQPVDSLFARWFKSAKTLKEALKRPLDSELEGLRKYIQRMLMRDDRRVPMPDLGFSVWLWNGGSGGDDVWLNFLCGGYWEKANNRCVITPPHKGPATERVLTTAFQTAVLHALATAWDPDWGVAMSHDHRDIIEKKCPDVLVGWVTYLSRRLGRVPPLPAPVRIEPVGELGSLVILTPERFTASNPEHLALAERVRERLDAAGLLLRSR